MRECAALVVFCRVYAVGVPCCSSSSCCCLRLLPLDTVHKLCIPGYESDCLRVFFLFPSARIRRDDAREMWMSRRAAAASTADTQQATVCNVVRGTWYVYLDRFNPNLPVLPLLLLPLIDAEISYC